MCSMKGTGPVPLIVLGQYLDHYNNWYLLSTVPRNKCTTGAALQWTFESTGSVLYNNCRDTGPVSVLLPYEPVPLIVIIKVLGPLQ